MAKRKLQSLARSLKDIERELEALKHFRPTPATKKLQRYLTGERSHIKEKVRQLQARTAKPTARERVQAAKTANRQRSQKMKRQWRYFRAVQENYYPDKSLRSIRSMFKKQKDGLETEIPEVAWQNPSP